MSDCAKFVLKPYIFVFRLTERCEVGCSHCSIYALRRGADSNLELLSRAISEIAEYGIGRLHLTGGEPLLFERISDVVGAARDAGLIVGCTTSTFTRPGQSTLARLEDMADQDISYAMLSYDDHHAKRVPQSDFIDFVEKAVARNIEVAVFTVESEESTVTSNGLRQACSVRGIPTESIDWAASDLNSIGRGERFADSDKQTETVDVGYPRCPIVLSAPTLNPDGTVSLCNCARFKTPKFTIGHYPDESIAMIVDRMTSDPAYRLLAKLGPQEILQQAGLPVEDDMCASCERFLEACEGEAFLNWVGKRADEEDLDVIHVDYLGLPAMYQRYLDTYGEQVAL